MAFLDADDQFSPVHLQRMIDLAGEGGASFVIPGKGAAVPDSRGDLRLLPAQATDSSVVRIEAHDFTVGLPREHAFVNRVFLLRHGIAFPENESGGDWMHLMAALLASGAAGYWSGEPTYLHRVTGSHYSSSLKAIREQLLVVTRLAEDVRLPNDVRAELGRSVPHVRRRLCVAALRDRQWAEFARLASRSPADLAYLPVSALRFIARKLYQRRVRRRRPAERPIPSDASLT